MRNLLVFSGGTGQPPDFVPVVLKHHVLCWEGRFDARLVQSCLQGPVHPVIHPPRICVRLDPPAYPVDHGVLAHLNIQCIDGFVGQHTFDLPHGVYNDLLYRVIEGATGHVTKQEFLAYLERAGVEKHQVAISTPASVFKIIK